VVLALMSIMVIVFWNVMTCSVVHRQPVDEGAMILQNVGNDKVLTTV
jgi:hypothetical protein